ncbi:MAG: hypothetical protein ACE14M_08705 [Terriglobales bacterium]
MKKLEDMIGEEIAVLVPMFHQIVLQKMTLHSVEQAGLWVEHQNSTNQLLSKIGLQSAPKTLVFFLPWHEVRMIWESLDAPALNEKAFGV